MNFGFQLRSFFLTCAVLGSVHAFAVSEDMQKPKPFYMPLFEKQQPRGAVSVVEWNPADLLFEKLSFSGEYLVVDGFAFGGLAEFQRQDDNLFRHTTSLFGVSATQYLENQSLKGGFLRGELAGMGSVFQTERSGSVGQQQAVYGLSLGADLGYRFQLSEHITGSASYGARRTVPDFFFVQGNNATKDWQANNRLWNMKVKIGLGVSL